MLQLPNSGNSRFQEHDGVEPAHRQGFFGPCLWRIREVRDLSPIGSNQKILRFSNPSVGILLIASELCHKAARAPALLDGGLGAAAQTRDLMGDL